MSSMPTPVDTARRASNAHTGTARQSIVVPECRTAAAPVNPRSARAGCEVVFALAGRGFADYHRFSMIAPTANVKVSPAAIAAFAIIAPPAR